ncbi:MAG: type II toxin-antitoxin system HipA family toxin [Methanomassiliicoccaceae archaeon]|nr:type II toxin-antitoxin system HipA family toxin [Methanomassiliicoccaceae archaeon]
MREKITEVRLWDSIVGHAYWNRERMCAHFQYDPSFLDRGYDIAPLTMPLSRRTYTFDYLNKETYHGLSGMMSDSLPDSYGNTLIDIWLSENRILKSEFTPLDRLCYIGNRGMGALEYRPAVGRSNVNDPIDTDALSSLASDVLRLRENIRADIGDANLQDLLSVGTSAGGARAKATVALNESTGDIRSGQIDLPDEYTYWIIKFDTETEKKKGYCRIEYAYHEMAAACDINMTECRLLDAGSKTHFMTKRFDRKGNDKIHMQTLCAMAHYDHKIPGKYSYDEMTGIMRRLHMPYDDIEQVFRRMVFNVIMRNQDDHTKNFSFLMERNKKWRLSPAYDITYAFDPGNYWTQRHQMSVNGKLEKIEKKDMNVFADNVGIRDPDDIIERTLSVASEWKEYAKLSGVPERSAEAIDAVLMI